MGCFGGSCTFFFFGFLPMPIWGWEGLGRGQQRGDLILVGGNARGDSSPVRKPENRVGDEETRWVRRGYVARSRGASRIVRVCVELTRIRDVIRAVATKPDTHLVFYVCDVVVNVRLPDKRLERLPLGSARASHRRARPVLVPPRHRAPVEPGVDGQVIFVQSSRRHRGGALESVFKAAAQNKVNHSSFVVKFRPRDDLFPSETLRGPQHGRTARLRVVCPPPRAPAFPPR